ncbi:hypothetical protein TAMA11512_23620 [Selenomonas sp. TAMA-11512]|nr:hypothetical protein TAMA11512_23620 [Selenomonas sp. TAMA-11512]
MNALVLTGKHEVHVGAFPEPPLAANAVKIAVAYCGLCGTDLYKYEGKSGSRLLRLPVPLGHEISGVVEAVGEQVKDFRPGDRVTADPNWSCGHCFFAKTDAAVCVKTPAASSREWQTISARRRKMSTSSPTVSVSGMPL